MRKLIYIWIALCACLGAQAQMNTDRLTAIGRNALYFDDYVLSMQYFNQVIKLKPYLAEPYLYRAIAKIQLGDYTGAEADCSRCIANSPFLPGAYYTRGYVYRMQGEFEKAEKDFTEALIFAPENRTYLLLRADVRAQMEKYEPALSDIDYLLRREPHAASIHFEKGVISMQMKDTTSALSSFKHATEYDPQNASNWSALGMTWLMTDSLDEALVCVSRSINLGSKWAGDYINRGIINYRRHNYRGAMADYDEAVTLASNNAQCYYNRAMLRQELGDHNRALEDFNRAIELEPENIEMRYQRGITLLELRQWQAANDDYDTLIAHYPYFLPSYYLAARAKAAMGDEKEAYRYQHKANELEKDKDKIRQQVNTSNQLAQSDPQKKDYRKQFSQRAAQNGEADEQEQKYQSASRGAVQNKYADVVSEGNIALSYYAQKDNLRQTNYYHPMVDSLNKQHSLPSPLHFTIQELPLSADMVTHHFDQIAGLSIRIDRMQTPQLYFARAIEFALVQDYTSAIEDCNRALLMVSSGSNDASIIYFCRANWRYKQLEYKRSTGELAAESKEAFKLQFEMIMRDYDQVMLQRPDFSFAYYNKANMLCMEQDYKAAIALYTRAIEVDHDFAEAYFNRGLTEIFIGQQMDGLRDLSKAGELGIYQSYNLISRFK